MKIYCSTSSFCEFSSEPLALLKNNSLGLKNNDTKRKLKKDELINNLADCVGVIAGTEIYSREVIDSLPKLKVISRLGVGTDSIDMDYASAKGIKVLITDTRPSQAVAELVLGLILNFYRKINISNNNLKNKIWKKFSGPLLNGKTVGIVGFGHIGKQLSLLLNGFNCKVLAFDVYKDESFASANAVIFKDINELLSESDIISLHLDLNTETRKFINEEKLEKMKNNCLLVNASRGEIIDEEALYLTLKNKKIMGACLDVFNKEPYNGPLLDLENVLLTPHIGSYANEIRIKMELEATNNLINELLK